MNKHMAFLTLLGKVEAKQNSIKAVATSCDNTAFKFTVAAPPAAV